MKIDPERLRTLREQKGLSRLKLAERSGISERTIQRLENEPQRSQKSQGHTLNNLAKALGVKEKQAYHGDLPLPNLAKAPTGDNPIAFRLARRSHRRRDSPTTSSNADMVSMSPRSLTWHRSSSRFWPRQSRLATQKIERGGRSVRSFDAN